MKKCRCRPHDGHTAQCRIQSLPPDFYDRPQLRAGLRAHNFQGAFVVVLSELRLTQEAVADLVELDPSEVSRVSRGVRAPFTDARVILRVANGLRIPARLLGFYDPPVSAAEEEVDWMKRRDFHSRFAALALAVGACLDLDRLKALLPTPGEEPLPRQIGAKDVAAIEAATETFRTSHYQHGGGLERAAAVAKLGRVLNLNEVKCSEAVRTDLRMATAALANTASWMSVEAGLHADARRLSMIGLSTAREAQHPYSTDLGVEVLMNMALQAMHLGQPQEAISLVGYAEGFITMRKPIPVSAVTRHYVDTNLALAHAMLGQTELCLSELDQAGHTFAHLDPSSAPPWAARVDAATDSDWRGLALFQLSRTDPGYAPEAIERLRIAIDEYGEGRAVARARSLPALAGSYVHAGDLDAAVSIGHQAVTTISDLSSTIPYPWLRTLAEVTAPHSHRSDVTELRHRISEVLPPQTAV
jgi:transcriptional regulator with XRE-family HTH domain